MHDFVALGISLGLGLLIGLQRERSDSHLGGIRTFPLISLLGTLCAMLANRFGWAALFGGFIGVAGSLVAANYLRGRSDPASEAGQTTGIAGLLTFALGAYIVNGDWPIAFVAAGIIVVLLHLKAPMHRFVAAMGERDMNAVMQFVVITLIVFPLLPNRPYGPYKVLNPYDIWRMVVLIVAISLSGYVAYKVLGQRAGIFLSGILGGLISSTATTVSYARRSREARGIHALAVFVVVIASAIAFASGLTDMDAITLSVARMVDQQRIDPSNGWKLILVASMSNLAFKAGAGVFLGGGRFGVRLILAFGAGIAGGLLLLFFWH